MAAKQEILPEWSIIPFHRELWRVWHSKPLSAAENIYVRGDIMLEGGDMIVNLYNLPERDFNSNIKIKRAFIGDKDAILSFVQRHFQKNWVYEVEKSLMQDVSKCFVATENGKILGFSCYDSSAKGFFGPIGVDPERRGEQIGRNLLIKTLDAMWEYGYGYAIIGWVTEAESFYRRVVGAEFIKGGNPENSVYSNLIFM